MIWTSEDGRFVLASAKLLPLNSMAANYDHANLIWQIADLLRGLYRLIEAPHLVQNEYEVLG
jgi:hypothetical protein